MAVIGGELVVGGVEYPVDLGDGRAGWRMVFHRGRALEALEPFLVGPDHMKDIRLVEVEDGRVGVFSRPQGECGGRGTIGFTTVASLSELTASAIEQAPLLRHQFRQEEWGGANQAHLLKDGTLGVLGRPHSMRASATRRLPGCSCQIPSGQTSRYAAPSSRTESGLSKGWAPHIHVHQSVSRGASQFQVSQRRGIFQARRTRARRSSRRSGSGRTDS